MVQYGKEKADRIKKSPFGLFIVFLFALFALAVITRNQYVILTALGFTLVAWPVYIIVARIKMGKSDFNDFYAEMKNIGLPYFQEVLVTKNPKGPADIERDGAFRVSFDNGETWKVFYASDGAYNFRDVYISRQLLNGTRLVFNKKEEVFAIFEKA